MRLTESRNAILFLSVLFQTVIFHLPKLTYGNEISDGDNQDVQDRLDLQLRFTSRSMESDDTCENACKDDSMSSFKVSFQPSSLMLETEDEDATGTSSTGRGFFSRITGFFDGTKNVFGRLMNNLFRIFNRSKEDDPKYMISTEYILPFLSTYSTKFKSLAAMIRQESKSDAALSTKPDAIQMMYNISTMNIEAVATVIDPIMDDMRQSKTIDIRTLSCSMMQILTLLRDVTVPNIQSITKLIYTATSDNAEMRDVFYDYFGTISNETTDVSTSLMNESSGEKGICPDTLGGKIASFGLFDDGILNGLLLLLLGPCGGCDDDVGPIAHITAIILWIVLFPLSIVAGIAVGISLLLLRLFCVEEEPDEFGEPPGNDGPLIECSEIFRLAFRVAFGAPLLVVFFILINIREFFYDILDPFLPDAPSPLAPPPSPPPYPMSASPSMSPNTPVLEPFFNTPINPPAIEPDPAQRTSDLTHRLAAVLESPIDKIVNAIRNANQFLDASTEDEEEMDCEMAALKCKNDALIDILPF